MDSLMELKSGMPELSPIKIDTENGAAQGQGNIILFGFEEIDAVFKSGAGSGEVLKSAILTGEAADSIRNAYQNVADKYQDVLTLEASVAELHQMFLDFALLTEKQGELLGQIEHQVQEAGEYVEQGSVEIVEATRLLKSIRANQCCAALVVLTVLGIIVGLVVDIRTVQFQSTYN